MYQHQIRIIKDDPKKCLLGFGTGSGKSRIALELARGKTLVLCPKQQKIDRTWEINADKFGIVINITVISKEEFRRDWEIYGPFNTVIIDECHTVLGVTTDTKMHEGMQVPKTSQLFRAVRLYLKKWPPARLYLASATAVTKPMHLFAIATLMGRNWNFFDFRARYYFERKMGFRTIYMPRQDEPTKQRLANLTKTFGYFGTLSDWFDVPAQTHEEVDVELGKEQKDAIKQINSSEADPLVKRAKKRTIENGILYGISIEEESEKVDNVVHKVDIFPSKKIDYILERAQEFKKILIFAAYTAQINEIEKSLKNEGYNVFTLTGATKNRGEVISDAERSERAIVIAQSSISSGYELPSFPCVIFASKSYRYVDYEQALGRVLRANALKKNLYVHLIVKGGVDEDCHKAIMSGQDFQEKVMGV